MGFNRYMRGFFELISEIGACKIYSQLLIKVPITPQKIFRFVKSLHGIRKNAAKIFAID